MKPKRESKYIKFWMDTDILLNALANCDLGDAYSAKVRQYPHKDMVSKLTEVIEKRAFDYLMKEAMELRRALKFYQQFGAGSSVILTNDMMPENGRIAIGALERFDKFIKELE